MSLVSSTAKITSTAAAAGFYDYPIEQSLRFDGSSYLSRVLSSPSNRFVYTASFWIKRSNLSTTYGIMSAGSYNSPYETIRLTDTDYLTLSNDGGGSAQGGATTSGVLRDVSSWGHIVVTRNVNSVNIYFNSKLFANGTVTSTISTLNTSGETQRIGADERNQFKYSGYLANIQFIDGQALDPYFFGESKNGVWMPYNAFSTAGSGTATASDGDTATDSYGTNGFHLTFEDGIETLSVNGSNVSAFRDKSGNSNHWKIN